jgi:hypothetical protein
MNIEHIEMQMIAALVYLAYALIMLAGNRTAWQKRKTVIIGFTPALLFGLVFVVQYLLEFAYMETYMPIALTQAFTTFYTNINFLMFLNGLFAVIYLVLPVSGKFVQELANTSKQTNKYQVNSTYDCIQAMDASSAFLRQREIDAEHLQKENDEKVKNEEDDWVEANSKAAEDEYWHGRPGY